MSRAVRLNARPEEFRSSIPSLVRCRTTRFLAVSERQIMTKLLSKGAAAALAASIITALFFIGACFVGSIAAAGFWVPENTPGTRGVGAAIWFVMFLVALFTD